MKSLGRRIVACLLGVAVVLVGAWLWLRHDYRNYCASGAFVLEYHAIGSHPDWPQNMVVAPEVFEQHLAYLQANGYQMVTVAELAERLASGKSVGKYIALSFDDGYTDNYTQAFPLMKKYGARGTFAIINSKINGNIYMNTQQLQEMEQAGMEIASHTFSHNRLDEIEPKYYDWEIGVSKYDLEKRVLKSTEVRTLAYPCGGYNETIEQKLKHFGYVTALTGNEFLNTSASFAANPMAMNRLIILDDGKNSNRFAWLLHRGYCRSYLRERGLSPSLLKIML